MLPLRWCGNTVSTAWRNVTAQSNTMVVMFRADNYFNITTRTAQASFSATIFFGKSRMRNDENRFLQPFDFFNALQMPSLALPPLNHW